MYIRLLVCALLLRGQVFSVALKIDGGGKQQQQQRVGQVRQVLPEDVFLTMLVGVDIPDDRALLSISLQYWEALGVKPGNILVTFNGMNKSSEGWASALEISFKAGVLSTNIIAWEGSYDNVQQKQRVNHMMHLIEERISGKDPSKIWIMQADVDEFPVMDSSSSDLPNAHDNEDAASEGILMQRLHKLAQSGFNALPGIMVDRIPRDGHFRNPEQQENACSILEQFPIPCNLLMKFTHYHTAVLKNVGFTADLLPTIMNSAGGGHHLRELSGKGSSEESFRARCPPLQSEQAVEVAHMRFTAAAAAKNKHKADIYGAREPDYKTMSQIMRKGSIDPQLCKGFDRTAVSEMEEMVSCCVVLDPKQRATCQSDYDRNNAAWQAYRSKWNE